MQQTTPLLSGRQLQDGERVFELGKPFGGGRRARKQVRQLRVKEGGLSLLIRYHYLPIGLVSLSGMTSRLHHTHTHTHTHTHSNA